MHIYIYTYIDAFEDLAELGVVKNTAWAVNDHGPSEVLGNLAEGELERKISF